MAMVVNCLLAAVASLAAIAAMIFTLEIAAAIALPRSRQASRSPSGRRPRVAVLVPAHNESSGLLPTLADIQSQLLPGDRLLVVADNCADDTAAVARARGAEVAERHDATRQGKGYALGWGVEHLSSDPPEIVMVIDADCRLADGAVDGLALSCATTGRPAQALYLMTAPNGSQTSHQVAEFAWRVRNWLRPLGLGAMGLPCQLMGTGMAFPWNVIRSAELANGRLVEDLVLGLELTLSGHPPLFCPDACVTSVFATSLDGARTQRKRWEHGHLDTILREAPRLLASAIARRDRGLLALSLDLAVPPLSLLGMLNLGMVGAGGFAAVLGFSQAALVASTAGLLVFLIGAALAWVKCGRDVVPPRAVLSIVLYAVGKCHLYRQFLFGKMDRQWIRTDRK
jgi:cellulose synthase/poly-beta-1,6-N-acetylglucosamine synthase-like glycosyltransferase